MTGSEVQISLGPVPLYRAAPFEDYYVHMAPVALAVAFRQTSEASMGSRQGGPAEEHGPYEW